MSTKFLNDFEKFLEQYFCDSLSNDITSENLFLCQKNNYELYEKIKNLLPQEAVNTLLELDDSYNNKMAEANKLYFKLGFLKCRELFSYLYQSK